jgi:uncharacterized membrane protein/mono/diheme cytochrome c family protein
MTFWGHRVSGQFRLGLLTLAPILIVAVLLALLPPDGNERAEWAQFIGRFHPLAIHFPIALILLVPLLELAGLNHRLSYLRLSVGFVLGLATLGATVAAILGWCLGRSGGYSGPLVTQHMWGGVSLAAVCWVCWILRSRTGERGLGLIYGIALAAGFGLVVWTGYRGGQLSLGEDHLTEHMPGGLRQALRLSNSSTASSASSGPNTFYGARVEPIFEGRCVTCHGPNKHRANLRLDSYRAAMRGGKDGPVVQAGNVQGSDLFRRITLPPGHDDFMPKEGKRPLSPDQVKLIALWIGAGASGTLPVDAIKDVPTGSASPATVAEVTFEEIDTAAVTKLRAAIAPAVAQLQKRFPNILEYESRGSANLYLNASILGPKFGDSDLVALAPLAEHITVADFSRTAITDRSASSIAAMKRLRVLRLMHTGISDAAVQALGSLDQLEALNVFDTRLTPAALPTIARLPKLAHCYAGQTAIPTGMALPKDLKGKVIF